MSSMCSECAVSCNSSNSYPISSSPRTSKYFRLGECCQVLRLLLIWSLPCMLLIYPWTRDTWFPHALRTHMHPVTDGNGASDLHLVVFVQTVPNTSLRVQLRIELWAGDQSKCDVAAVQASVQTRTSERCCPTACHALLFSSVPRNVR